MLEVTNVKVYDLVESVIASGNAMRIKPVDYTDEEFTKGLARMKRLINASKNSNVKCHDNALTGIRVSFDVKYPQYWTPEFQRYNFADIVTSASKMHRLTKMDLCLSCNKYTDPDSIKGCQKWIDLFNNLSNAPDDYIVEPDIIKYPNSDETANLTNKEDFLYFYWMCALSSCPQGLELFMRISTNYKQLQTIYYQRKNHKLKEDWGNFCKFIEDLPYFNELILGN